MKKRRNFAQPSLYDGRFPLEEMIDLEDELCILADHIIDWDAVSESYDKNFESEKGPSTYPARLAFGLLFLKAKTGLSDRDLVKQLSQNAVYQYFCGFHFYSPDNSCDASLMTHFRKRFPEDVVNRLNELHFIKEAKKSDSDDSDDSNDSDDEDHGDSSDKSEDSISQEESDKNRGTLILDATCCPADVKYPTDLDLVAHSREWTERIVDHLYKVFGPFEGKSIKPRTYRERAAREYKSFSKNPKNQKSRKLRPTLRYQLSCLKRNLGHIDRYCTEHTEALEILPSLCLMRLGTVRKVYEQQYYMYKNRTHRVPDRIVSLSQPWIRPIVRGKAKEPTEFGAKMSMSVVNGMCFVDKISFDAYNEGENQNFIENVEQYRSRFGVYPEVILADKIYGNRQNRRWCKEHGIRLSAPRLGRKPKHKDDLDRLLYQDMCDRNEIECKFGNMKRGGSLNLVMEKLEETTKTSIHMSVFVSNAMKVCREYLEALFCRIFWLVLEQFYFSDFSMICRSLSL